MRLLVTLCTLIGAAYGFWWLRTTHPELTTQVEQFIRAQQFTTLEIRYSASQIMDAHRKELLKSNRHRYLEPQVKFYPYVLLEVKYNHSAKETREGVVLWDLTDGEMVIDAKHWSKTHGFEDCINAGAERHEFKILYILAQRGGTADREALERHLHVDHEVLDGWIESCRRKQLIVQRGNKYRLHIQNPRLGAEPETMMEDRLVTQTTHNLERVSRRYSLSQIQRLARCAFGADFTIRSTTDVYLPVHCIVVQNPDGSIHSTHWNALNGKRLP